MREFERITIDPNVANGLPCIRDTGITVSEIVKAIQGGISTNEVINKFEDLTIDDVIEAQSYAINDLIRNIWVSQNDGINPFTAVIQFAGYIADLTEVLTREHREFMGNSILRSVELSRAVWQNLSEWAQNTYDKEHRGNYDL